MVIAVFPHASLALLLVVYSFWVFLYNSTCLLFFHYVKGRSEYSTSFDMSFTPIQAFRNKLCS